MNEMPRWQYWVRDRGGDKNIALMELVACSMISFLALCALFFYVAGLAHLSYEVKGKDHSQISFLTAVYFLYVLVMVVLFRWTKMARKERSVYRDVVSGLSIILFLSCLYFAMESHARGFHLRNMANFGVVLSFWYFERSRMINFYFKGFLFCDKQKTGGEIEKSIEEDRERFLDGPRTWYGDRRHNQEMLIILFHATAFLYVSAVWLYGSLQLIGDSSLIHSLYHSFIEE